MAQSLRGVRGNVVDKVETVLSKQPVDQIDVGYRTLDKLNPTVVWQVLDESTREVVEHDNGCIAGSVDGQNLAHDVSTDKTSSAGDKAGKRSSGVFHGAISQK